ncbi:GDP-L-fucose synthase [Clostridium sp.]|uniref:GDP-L-fucose synthase family protein n=1 Tax=Clostridium sp. TaxID=1506 RepID=UPI00291523EE|nr:GDP-L-fucose synthase [Clostridium sp.]MDU4738663.1 GDP-L-fucose synthase [Clostridium sp.]
MNKDSKIYVAGHRGLVGSAIVRELNKKGYINIIGKTHKELDLMDALAVENFFKDEKPEYVFLAAAKVGGIYANSTYPADFIYENLQIQNNVIGNAYKYGVKKLMFLGSSCIYPKMCPQPIKEEYLLSGYLEETNEAYALAKISGLKMCQYFNKQYGTNFISVMPTNLYGPYDNFHPEHSHVMPALIRRFHEAKVNGAKEVVVWGSGKPLREFLYSEDMADASIYLMENYEGNDFFNIGTGKEITIKGLAELIKEVVGYEGEIVWDSSKPDGTPRKLLDVSRLESQGWKYKMELKDGIKESYNWYLKNYY